MITWLSLFFGFLTMSLQPPIFQAGETIARDNRLPRSHLAASNLFRGAFSPVLC